MGLYRHDVVELYITTNFITFLNCTTKIYDVKIQKCLQ